MAKLDRIYQRIFGSTAGASEIGKFGSLAAGTPLTTTDPAVAMSLSNWLDGWFSAIVGSNSPAIEDMNAVCFVLARQLAYLFQAGVAEWDTTTVYYIGSMVNANGGIYVSLTDTNTGNAVSDTANWRWLGSTLRQVAGDTTLAITDDVLEIDATSTNRTVTLPTTAAFKGKKAVISKTDASTNYVAFTNLAVSTRLLAQYDSITVFYNGTVWYPI